MIKECFNDWLFKLNPYTGNWYAATREHAKDLQNNLSSPHVITSSKIETLIDLINIADGDINMMETICSGEIPTEWTKTNKELLED